MNMKKKLDGEKEEVITDDMSVGSGAVAMPAFPLGMKSSDLKGGTSEEDPILRRKDWKLFDVGSDTFRKFEIGRNKFARWKNYLSDEIDEEKAVKVYAQKKPSHTIILRNRDTGALRAIRRKSTNGI